VAGTPSGCAQARLRNNIEAVGAAISAAAYAISNVISAVAIVLVNKQV
jgi:hypothetical protein